MNPRIKLSASQMQNILTRNLKRAEGGPSGQAQLPEMGMPDGMSNFDISGGMPPAGPPPGMMPPGMPPQGPPPGMPLPSGGPPVGAPSAMPQAAPAEMVPPGMAPPSPPQEPMVDMKDVPSLIQEAEAIYTQLIESPESTLGSYWHSLFSSTQAAKQYKDPEMYFISMFVQSEKDPAFAQKYPQEAKVMESVKEQAQPQQQEGGLSGMSVMDPADFAKHLTGEQDGNVGRDSQPTK